MHGHFGKKEKLFAFFSGIGAGVLLLVLVVLLTPGLRSRLDWRIEVARAYARGVVNPFGELPTAAVTMALPTDTATPRPSATATIAHTGTPVDTATPLPTPTATATLPPPPPQAMLDAPAYEKQDMNNCGPAALAMYLRYFGWEGDQFTIADSIKPVRQDRNVNVEELVSYMLLETHGIDVQYRVGGSQEMLKQFVAAGMPVMVEAGMHLAESYWPDDDHWAGHYLVVTGYDDKTGYFTVQDTFRGPNTLIDYEKFNEDWQAFNYVYMILYTPDQRPTVERIMGLHWGVIANREHALALAQSEIDADSTDSYAWFNLGTNLVYFEKYSQAAVAYDNARSAGLPQRMLRYQFGPFFAYFHTGRIDDLIALTDYALKITPNSEEAMLWRGWAMYRKGDRLAAAALYEEALLARPGYTDAEYALNFLREN